LSAPADKNSFPPGLNNAYFFSVFNALSFQLVLSSPMVLYAKTLHASATVLGIITGMMPLLTALQIPAASYINRIGYKRFVLGGWSVRVAFIFLIALVPLAGAFLNEGSRLALVLALLFGFNFSRGFSSCAWLPWISSLVPANARGHYLARDAACVNLASFVSFALAAVVLGSSPRSWQFAVLFAFSAAMGAISLSFLKQIPDMPVSQEPRGSQIPVPWVAMLRFGPFQKLLRVIVAWSLAYGGLQAFTVVFLKTALNMADSKVLLITGAAYVGGLSSLWVLGTRLDGLGSKPVLTFCFAVWIAVLAGWAAIAGRVLQPTIAILLLLQILMGLLGALVQMSNTRLAMAIVPHVGRNHFFALFSVIGSVALGLAPMVWGLLLDALGLWQATALGLVWNRFSVFFVAVGLVMISTLLLARQLDEPEAASLDELLREVLIESPQRFLVRFWPRG
jgi:MFS family permease